MASPLDTLLEAVKRNVLERATGHKDGAASGGLLDQLGDLLGKRKTTPGRTDVKPASEDPYGDPADQQDGAYAKARPASEDPYGDPADEEAGAYAKAKPASEDPYGDPADPQSVAKNVKPASEDPYGDPADEGTRKA